MSHLIDHADAETVEAPRRDARTVFGELMRVSRQVTLARYTLMQAQDPSSVHYFDNSRDGQTETARPATELLSQLDAETEALIAEYKATGGTQEEVDILFEEMISAFVTVNERTY